MLGAPNDLQSQHTRGTISATVNPASYGRSAQDVIGLSHVQLIATETVSVGTTTSITSSGSSAKKGDCVWFVTGANANTLVMVYTAIGTIYTFGQQLSTAPGVGDSFQVLRYRHPTVDSNGNAIVVSGGVVPLTGNAPGTATAGVASGTMVAANSSRKGLIITNTSTNRVFLATEGAAAVLNRGIYLGPGGGTWTMGAYDFTLGAITGIAAAAGSTLSYQEFQ